MSTIVYVPVGQTHVAQSLDIHDSGCHTLERMSMTRYLDWVRALFATAFLAITSVAGAAGMAQIDADNPTHKLQIGRLTIYQKSTAYLYFVLPDGHRIDVSDTAGFYWPPVATDEHGRFYIGTKSLDSRSGDLIGVDKKKGALVLGPHYTVVADDARQFLRIKHAGRECTVRIEKFGLSSADVRASDLLQGVIRFVDADGPLVGLVTLGGKKAGDTRYLAVRILADACRVESIDLGNPDLLVEIGWTRAGHWWITGSKEGTLLRSGDGKKWVKMHMPDRITELISAYVVAPDHIWLAANYDTAGRQDDPELVYTDDGGKNWIRPAWAGKQLSQVPPYWLEGQMRARGKPVPDMN